MALQIAGIERPEFEYLKTYDSSGLESGISSDDQLSDAEQMLVGYKALKAKYQTHYNEMLAPLNKERSTILGWLRDHRAACEDVIQKLQARVLAYTAAKDASREQAAATALAQAQDEADAKRQVEVDELRENAEVVSGSHPTEALAMKQEAAALEKTPAPIVKTFDDVEPTTTSPLTTVTTYSAKVIDIYMLAKAVLDREVSHLALQPNQTWLNQQARSMKQAFKVDGVEVIATQGLRRKGGYWK